MIAFSEHDLNDIGFRLMAALIQSQRKILIAEDFEFLENYFRLTCSQSSGSIHNYIKCKLKHFSLFTSGFLTFLCATILRQTSFINDPSSYITTACIFLSFLDIGFYISISFKKWLLQKKFISLCDELDSNMQNLRDLYNLILEFEAIEERVENFINKSSQLRSSAFTQCRDVFELLRVATIKARHFPTAFSDVETDENYISSIPFEAFDDLMANECLRTNSQLKSLIQLIKLQQSEFVRRLICVLNPLSRTDSYQLVDRIIELLVDLHRKLEPCFTKIRMLVVLSRSCWFSSEKKERPAVNPLFAELLTTVKQSRIYLQSALLHLEDVDTLLHQMDRSQMPDENKKVVERFESALKEMTNCCDFINSILRKHWTKQTRKLKLTPCLVTTSSIEVQSGTVVDEDYKPEIRDQVFESTCAEEKHDTMEGVPEIFTTLERTTMPSILYEELKSALLPKAKENQEREAKALGVPVGEVPIQLSEEPSTSVLSNKMRDLGREKESLNDSAALEIRQEGKLSLHQFNLSNLIAATAVKKSKGFSVGDETQFGDDSDGGEDDHDDHGDDCGDERHRN